ncbi:MAG TPA: flagellar hook-length control protein FliK [Gallionellaceae bacterium]|nr:flagellar hook-length control protein FliK [Gallionellaceae bacterium]
MIPVDVLNSLKGLMLSQKPLILATPATSTTAAFELGQKYQGSVQAQLSPGLFRVQIADQLVQLQLPGSIRTGDTITLQVASLLPRLTFNIAASANPLSTPDQLSTTSRLLSSLAQQPMEKAFIRPGNSAPLWTGTTQLPDIAELAGKLHTTISQSGLFYESHQAQWLAGSRNTAQLLQEPQNLPADQLKAAFEINSNPSPANATAALNSVKSAHHTAQPAPEPATLPAEQPRTGLSTDDKISPANTAPTTHSASTANTAQERISIPGIPDHLQPLIQQQLYALETRQVQWQGQVWPNQEMNWKIQEETSHASNGEEGRQWATQIQLDLPNLGEVTATLRFGSSGLSIALDTDKSATRAKLGTASSMLVAALSDRGINISSALVTQHDNT